MLVAYAQPSTAGIFGGWGAALALWRPGTTKADRQLPSHGDSTVLAFSGDGRRLITGGWGKQPIRVWDLDAGKEVGPCPVHDAPVKSVSLSADGRLAASLQWPTQATPKAFVVRVWETTTGRVLSRAEHVGWVNEVALSPDGSQLAIASRESLQLWGPTQNKVLGTLKGTVVEQNHALVFSADGATLAAVGGETVVLWDTATGRERAVLRGHHPGAFGGLAYSTDGRRVATARGREVKLWDAASGQEILTLPLLDDAPPSFHVLALTFSPDGQRLLAALSDGTVQAWDATPRRGQKP
jgi:WD40 repeat protein